ncbi:NAD(P)H-dependent glycerol-3-phosphate dehydrogenase [Amycolatopsis alkalitolerans]|uniref:Glycerol-3-phosphate dehydrogenase n=1 Tax=Amycolatopsis alkalitolerans TaxID=2547244 RepID=A0A5C4MBT2_9PSEU|nr:2-dehydropantoate 2-reductase N-terminal domain-containing protein [Amycolatopsis alkalitolerans]TNC29582.1 glycerol-3-phosphate dehydrogenase [Amycolatopsis alkalitolerans]
MTARAVTILGAGAMGSALATPLADAGWAVNLWGTWLDDHLLAACRRGEPHPRTGVPLAGSTTLFDSPDLDDALAGADLAVLAVASAGVAEVTRRAARGLAKVRAVLLTSKGFAPDADGRIRLLPDAMRDTAAEQGVTLPPVIAVGGPCKANEVAARRPTGAVFAARDKALAEEIAKNFATPAYRAEPLDDVSGVEVCAPMKNVYAIALGVCDGLAARGGEPFHDLKAATFAAAVRELVLFAELVGGGLRTAIGLAGAGDLEVTGNSGRNKIYGVRIGAGESAAAAYAAMQAEERTVEGVPAAGLAAKLVDQRAPQLWSELPLFRAIRDILAGHDDPGARITDAVLPRV